jgi:hypothetical protein
MPTLSLQTSTLGALGTGPRCVRFDSPKIFAAAGSKAEQNYFPFVADWENTNSLSPLNKTGSAFHGQDVRSHAN